MYLHEARKSRVVNHRMVKKRIYCPVIWNHTHFRLIESWVQHSLTSDPRRLWRFSHKVELSFHLLKSQRCLRILEKEYDVLPWTRWHMRPWHWQEVYCLQNYQQRCVWQRRCVPDTRILRRASLAQLSVCECPHVCTLPPPLTSARYPWISNLSISIVFHYFRWLCTYLHCEAAWNEAMSLTTFNSSDTKRVECSFVDLSWQQIYYWQKF